MTVSSTVNRISYACGGGVTSFAYPFKIFDEADLVVILRSAAGVETTLAITTEYSVDGVGEDAGGNVTTVATYAAGNTLVIKRELAILQETDYIEGGAFQANSHEDALDKGAMISQQLDEEIGRALKLAVSSSYTDIEVPDPAANKYLGWNAAATALENKDLVAYADMSAHDNTATAHAPAIAMHNAATLVHSGWNLASNMATGPVLLANGATVAAGNDASRVVTPAGLKEFLGYETIMLPIGAFLEYGAAANAATIDSQIYPSTKKQIDYAEFGYSASWEGIDLRWALGPGWDVSTLKLKYLWMPGYNNAIVNGASVCFGAQVKHLVDGKSLDTNHSTPPVYVQDRSQNTATAIEYITAASANVASGAVGDLNVLDMRITRNNTISNNATAPVRLTGILAMMRRNQTITEW